MNPQNNQTVELPALPEQSLEVLGKLRPASVARVHRDEDANGWAKTHILSHEVKPLLLISDGVLDAFDLNTQRRDLSLWVKQFCYK